MKAAIDSDLCTACNLCVEIAPEVFRMGDTTAEPISPVVAAGHEEEAREAAQDCPTEAISLQE